MRFLEMIVAALLILVGGWSAFNWARKVPVLERLRDHLVFALFVTGRSGTWLALAGFFLISASIPYAGSAYVDAMADYRWYLMVPIGLAALQLLAGWSLGRRSKTI